MCCGWVGGKKNNDDKMPQDGRRSKPIYTQWSDESICRWSISLEKGTIQQQYKHQNVNLSGRFTDEMVTSYDHAYNN